MFVGVITGALLIDLRRGTGARRPEGARAALPPAPGAHRTAAGRPWHRPRRASGRHGRRPPRADAATTAAADSSGRGPATAANPAPSPGPRASASPRPSGSGGRPVELEPIKGLIRDVPDFPQEGIVFKDITPLLADPSSLLDRDRPDRRALRPRQRRQGGRDRGPRVHPGLAGRVPLRRRVRAGPQAGQAAVGDRGGGVRAGVRHGDARDPQGRRQRRASAC